MAENKKAHGPQEPESLARFVRTQVDPLSRAFAASPLARLRVSTKHGSITLVKARPAPAAGRPDEDASGDASRPADAARPAGRHAPLAPATQNGEAGRTYTTISSEVVGIFHDAAQPPAPGEWLRSGQILGYIDALRLRNEVCCPIDSQLVAQVVVEGQPVDFGEALFVVDSTAAAVQSEASVETAAAPPEAQARLEPVEPPRM